jgi:hypothetical protein
MRPAIVIACADRQDGNPRDRGRDHRMTDCIRCSWPESLWIVEDRAGLAVHCKISVALVTGLFTLRLCGSRAPVDLFQNRCKR